MEYIMVMSQIKWKCKHYRGKLNMKVHLQTIVHRLQYPMLYRAGISSSLDVVIKSSNLEMSLRSKVLLIQLKEGGIPPCALISELQVWHKQ